MRVRFFRELGRLLSRERVDARDERDLVYGLILLERQRAEGSKEGKPILLLPRSKRSKQEKKNERPANVVVESLIPSTPPLETPLRTASSSSLLCGLLACSLSCSGVEEKEFASTEGSLLTTKTNSKKKTLSLNSSSFFSLQVAASASSSEIVLPNKYCESIFKTVRRPTRTINVGYCAAGGVVWIRWRDRERGMEKRSNQEQQRRRRRRRALLALSSQPQPQPQPLFRVHLSPPTPLLSTSN